MTLTIASPGVKLRKFGACVEVDTGEEKRRVPVSDISSILLTSPSSLTSDLIEICIEHSIPINMLGVTGRPLWGVSPFHGGAAPIIHRNQLALAGTAEGVKEAKALLTQKNRNRIDFLKRLASNRRNAHGDSLKACCAEIGVQMAQLEEVQGETVASVRQRLLGHEGAAGRAYFRAISEILPREALFRKRERGSGAGPFNQLLNYSYGILYQRLNGLCVQSNLNPYIGILHADAYNEPVLVYDLIEPFRFVAEETVVKLYTGRRVQKCRLIDGGGEETRLSTEGKKLLITALEERMNRSDGGYSIAEEMSQSVQSFSARMKTGARWGA